MNNYKKQPFIPAIQKTSTLVILSIISLIGFIISINSITVNISPSYNKRATVYYMVGEFQKSQDDIDKVLELEKRHFGALAGQGLVNIQLRNYEKAIKSYQMAEEIYPGMKSPKLMIKQIEELIKNQSI